MRTVRFAVGIDYQCDSERHANAPVRTTLFGYSADDCDRQARAGGWQWQNGHTLCAACTRLLEAAQQISTGETG